MDSKAKDYHLKSSRVKCFIWGMTLRGQLQRGSELKASPSVANSTELCIDCIKQPATGSLLASSSVFLWLHSRTPGGSLACPWRLLLFRAVCDHCLSLGVSQRISCQTSPASCCVGKRTWPYLPVSHYTQWHTKCPAQRGRNHTGFPKNPFLMSQGTRWVVLY